jgi:uncharacterized protein
VTTQNAQGLESVLVDRHEALRDSLLQYLRGPLSARLLLFMFLSVSEMDLRKIRFDESIAPGKLDFTEACLEQSTPLHATGTAEMIAHSDGEIRIQGRYTVEMAFQCDRCLAPARIPVEAGFDLFYRPVADIARAEEVEIAEGETEIGFYEGGGLELDDILHEQVLLALPMQRVCRESCKGICPVCGQNRNEAACDCKVPSGAAPFLALRDFGAGRHS